MAANKRFRSFSDTPELAGSDAPDVEVEPLGFELNGEEFEVFPECPGALLLEFIESADTGSGAAALLRFVRSVMEPEEYARLDKVLKDPKKVVKIEKITDIVKFLVEEYSGRPTTAS
jgi:hypothetical protein